MMAKDIQAFWFLDRIREQARIARASTKAMRDPDRVVAALFELANALEEQGLDGVPTTVDTWDTWTDDKGGAA